MLRGKQVNREEEYLKKGASTLFNFARVRTKVAHFAIFFDDFKNLITLLPFGAERISTYPGKALDLQNSNKLENRHSDTDLRMRERTNYYN